MRILELFAFSGLAAIACTSESPTSIRKDDGGHAAAAGHLDGSAPPPSGAGGTAGSGGRATFGGTSSGGTTSGGGTTRGGGTSSGGADAGAARGGSDAGTADGAAAGTSGCFAFDMPPKAALRASPHKVFAHYFAPFPISIDNRPEAADYYTRGYLAPDGESGKWQFCGGYLRDRPLVQAPSTKPTWFEDNYDLEIQRAVDMGLDGFTFDILGTSGNTWDRLGQLLSAAERTDPGFSIALMPDMYATFTGDPTAAAKAFVDAISTTVKAHPRSVFKLADGRYVVTPWGAEKRDASWWTTTLQALTDAGVPHAFVPLFANVPWEAAAKAMKETVPMYGTASWGARSPSGAAGLQNAAAAAHGAGLAWMAPVAPQDMRPKSLNYQEAQNSLSFRMEWDAAIGGGADWVQLCTWNDYSEHTEVSPSAHAGYAFADLAAYYVTWFKTGAPPAIVRDRLFYFHRSHATTAKPDLTKQTGGAFALVGATQPTDEFELVALLKSPGALAIEIGGVRKEQDAPAGLSTLRAPLAEGRPTFTLTRDGTVILSTTSEWAVSNGITYQDLYYRAGESPRCAR